jgi:hypothetical protein
MHALMGRRLACRCFKRGRGSMLMGPTAKSISWKNCSGLPRDSGPPGSKALDGIRLPQMPKIARLPPFSTSCP